MQKPWAVRRNLLEVFLLVLAAPVGTATAQTLPTDAATAAVSALGTDLLQKAAQPDANALLSPYSIQSAMAMAYAGADGATRDEMAKVLHYPADDAALHRSFLALRRGLEEMVNESEENSRRYPSVFGKAEPMALAVANRLFGQSGYDFRDEFQSLLKDNCEAPIEALDFVKEPGAAARHINEWVESRTRHRIRNLVSEDALSPLTRLVLVNAIYLKADWSDPFQETATRPGPFHVNGGQSVEVPMMTQTGEHLYAESEDFTALALPFRDFRLRFLILLPKQLNGLADLEKNLPSQALAGRMPKGSRRVTLFLPKFKIEPPALSLRKVFEGLGMKSAFNLPPGSANFERMAPRRPGDFLAISEVIHKTFLELGEKGVEAAAGTALILPTANIHEKPAKPVEMRVDHPFLFAIIHQPSGACLFLGHVTDPR